MESMKWKDPGRKRKQNLAYTDAEFVPGYDLHQSDFTAIN